MVPKEKIKPRSTIKIKSWDKLKEVHEGKLESDASFRSLSNFLKRHAGKKFTVEEVRASDITELKIYVKEDTSLYFILKEIESVSTEIELDNNLFEL